MNQELFTITNKQKDQYDLEYDKGKLKKIRKKKKDKN